jgi:hypothetical protein
MARQGFDLQLTRNEERTTGSAWERTPGHAAVLASVAYSLGSLPCGGQSA